MERIMRSRGKLRDWLHHFKLRRQFWSVKHSESCLCGLYDGRTCYDLERIQDRVRKREWKATDKTNKHENAKSIILNSSEIDAIFDQTESGKAANQETACGRL